MEVNHVIQIITDGVLPVGGGDYDCLQMGAFLTYPNGRFHAHGPVALVQIPAKKHSLGQS